MKIKTEVHTHTLVSHHAYNTMTEMITAAREKGIELIAFTDHGPAIPDGAHPYHFGKMKVLPRKVGNVYVIRGAEANIIDYEGNTDLHERLFPMLDWVIASIHGQCFTAGTVTDHTNAYLGVLENPYIDAIGHSGDPMYAYDIDAVLQKAKEFDKVIELNANSMISRMESTENCKKIARRCAELGVNVSISTDAHSIYQFGMMDDCLQMALSAGVQPEQIINRDAESFLAYLCRRRGYDRAMFEQTLPDTVPYQFRP